MELVAWFTGNDKVDEFINWWLNDEYVHVPGDEWYRGCSPAVERYSAPETSYDTAQIKHRFPVADSIHYPNNGVPYSVFMPVDNMARFWYEFFVATCHGPALSAVMHAIQDAGVPHHAAGYNGNWHGRFESDYDRLMSACLGDHGFADRVKQLYSLWTGNNNPCPVLLGESQWQLVPSMIWRIDQLVTWVALNAYREYAKTYDHYRQGYVFYPATAMWLAEITTAMCILVLTKSQRDRTARSGLLLLAIGQLSVSLPATCQLLAN